MFFPDQVFQFLTLESYSPAEVASRFIDSSQVFTERFFGDYVGAAVDFSILLPGTVEVVVQVFFGYGEKTVYPVNPSDRRRGR